MRSIRASLIAGSVLATVLVLTLSGVAIYRGARSTLVRQLDEALGDQARVIASVVKYTPDGMEVEVEDIDIPEFTSPSGHGYLQVWLDTDSVLYRSPRLEDHDLGAVRAAELNHPVFRWIRVEGTHVRAVDLRTLAVVDPEDWQEANLPQPKGPFIHLVAAQAASDVDTFLARLRALLIGIGALGGLLVAVLLAIVVQRSLRPLDHLAGQISGLSDENMSARVRMPVMPREVAPVVDQLNQLLARLEDAFTREHQFTSDIAHELRTPLAGLRATLEVSLSRTREPDDYHATMERLLAIVQRLQNMVETLLYLGRLDSGQVEIERQVVEISELATGVWEALAETARAKCVGVSLDLPHELNVTSDPVLLEVAMRNLFDNAVAYVNDGGHISIRAANSNRRVELRVANSGSMVPQEQVSELLGRFARADPSRRSGEHFGLGLALTSRIADAIDCDLEITSTNGGDFVVVLSVPSA